LLDFFDGTVGAIKFFRRVAQGVGLGFEPAG
jgi:hypothetical protein